MAYQLIYTSHPTSLTHGRSGFSTVARSRGIGDALANLVERCVRYDSTIAGDPVLAHSVVKLGASTWHVLTRARDCGTDYTNRNNYIAHHLVISEDEVGLLPSPADVALCWDGWLDSWQGEPRFVDDVDLSGLNPPKRLPAGEWGKLFGDCGCAALLGMFSAEIVAGRGDGGLLLALFAESMALFINRADSWGITFTTCDFPGGSVSDFMWRGVRQPSASAVADLTRRKSLPAPAGRGAEYARSGEMNNREKYNLTVEGPKFGQRRFEVVNVDSGKNAYAVPVLTGLVVGLLIIVAALLFVNFAYADSSEIGGMLDAGAQGAVKAGTPGGEREIFAERLK